LHKTIVSTPNSQTTIDQLPAKNNHQNGNNSCTYRAQLNPWFCRKEYTQT
jgi:hypothetical protein